MLGPWINFAIVICIQLLLFIICAYREKKLSDIPNLLWKGVLIGIPMGLLYDHLGNFLGINSYVLGFGLPFLLVNAAFSYGLFVANILILRNARLTHLYIWTVIIVIVYELTNHLFPVWIWEFALSPILFFLTLSAGYFGGAIFVSMISHFFFKYRFLIIDNVLNKTPL